MNEKYIRKLIRESISELEESRMTTSSYEITSKIMNNIEGVEKLDMRYMADGMAALFRYKDGNVYEIQIRPGSSIKDKQFWGGRLDSKEHPNKKMFRDLGVNKK